MSGAGRRALIAFGIITVGFWLSSAVFPQPIPPLRAMPDFAGVLGEVAPWIRKLSPSMDKPDAEVIATLRRQALRVFAVQWLMIATGIASGVLVALQRRAGRFFALGLCGGLLAWTGVDQIRLISGRHFVDFWIALAQNVPLYAAWKVMRLLFMAFTLMYLTRRSVVQGFAPDPRPKGTNGFSG